MGVAADAAEDTLDFEEELCTAGLDMAVVGAMAEQGAGTAAGAGKAGRVHLVYGIVIRFLKNRVAFADKYGYHNLAGGSDPKGWPQCSERQEADFGWWAPAFSYVLP